jgi:serine protease Do
VTIAELSEQQREELGGTGVLVEQVDSGSAAESAGIRSGDVIVSFNQQDVTSASQLQRLVRQAPTGEPLPVLIQRNNSPLFSALTLG